MPIVPIRPGAAPAGPPASALPPPDPSFLMMAAAQMHKEGRLVSGDPKIPETVRSRPEIAPSEPPRHYFPTNGRQDKSSMMT